MSKSMREAYVDAVESIADERPEYRLGGDGSDGSCDCVGAGIGALRRMGIEYDGERSTNWIARREAVELWEIQSVKQLRVGDNVLKAYEPDDAKWDLPERFRSYKDTRDYYHFGVVTSVNPLRILHMTSPTFKTDTTLGRWRFAFLWRQLSEAEEEKDMPKAALYDARVVLESGWLNLRNGPSSTARDIGDIPNGAIVEVLVDGQWPFVRFAGKTGYVKGSYLERIEEAPEIVDPGEPESSLPENVLDSSLAVTIVDSAGNRFYPVGGWQVEIGAARD